MNGVEISRVGFVFDLHTVLPAVAQQSVGQGGVILQQVRISEKEKEKERKKE